MLGIVLVELKGYYHYTAITLIDTCCNQFDSCKLAVGALFFTLFYPYKIYCKISKLESTVNDQSRILSV